MACNSAMAGMFPDLAEFLGELNRRTVDLMDVFKEDYVDAAFLGSTSIKKVLPVLCPDLKYDEDAVHDGARSEEHTSELQSLMRISYDVFCLKKHTNKCNT